MSARIPVIVSDAGALAEVVGGESYPYIVSAGQPLDLAAAIKSLGEELRENSSDLAERTSELFWRWQENYSPEAGKVRVGEVLNASLANPYARSLPTGYFTQTLISPQPEGKA